MHKRIFLGISLPQQALQQLEKYYSLLPEQEEVRKTPPQNLHITTYFIGKTAIEDINALLEVLPGFFKKVTPFTLVFEKYIVKKRRGIPAMIWAQYQKNTEFRQLIEGLHQEVNKVISAELDYKDPIPHITLVRCKFNKKQVLNIPQQPVLKEINVNTIDLWESRLTPSGAEYHLLRKFPFSI